MLIQKVRAASASVPAPIGGWNARDSLVDMEPTDAPLLTNWFPATTECVMRAGYTRYATGITGQVETILSYAGAATTKLFACAGGNVYDCTSSGIVGAAVVTGKTNARWQYVNMATAGGNFLMAVNGADKLEYFDGAAWSADGGGHTITGVDTRTWTNLTLHKSRVWAVQENTLQAWYLAPESIAGAATLFDLSPFFQMGGQLVSVGTWTIDAGQGVDDYLVFISSRGEVLVYQGTDPTSPSTWAMKGLWRIGSPVGARCLYKYSGDLLVISQDGVLPLSGALQSSRVNPRVALSNKIQYATSTAITNYGSTFGWQLLNFPKQNLLLLNVPIGPGLQQQYVMNTISQSWCNFTGWSASCWEIYRDDIYFGGDGFVGKAWQGYTDAGSLISADGMGAFDYFNYPTSLKRFTMLRPNLRASSRPTVWAGMNIDFDTQTPPAPISFVPTPQSLWDTALWDDGVYGSDLTIYRDWQGANGVGWAAAPRVVVQSLGADVRWVSTDIVMERGAIL